MAAHFRMTDGNACSASASIGERNPFAVTVGSTPARTVSLSAKCVNTCITSPARRHATPGIGACAVTASASVHGSARQGVPGNSVIPPSRPVGGRVRSRTRADESSSQNATP